MPVITMSLGKDQATIDQKGDFIKTVTEKASEILNIPEQAFIVLINETEIDNIGIGGKSLRAVRAASK